MIRSVVEYLRFENENKVEIGKETPVKHSEKQIGTVARELKINARTIRYYENLSTFLLTFQLQ